MTSPWTDGQRMGWIGLIGMNDSYHYVFGVEIIRGVLPGVWRLPGLI